MKTLTALLLLISTIAFSQEDTITIDSTPYTKWSQVSISDYYAINATNSQGKGYAIGKKTERTYPMNITHYCFDKDSVLHVALRVNPTNQIGFEFPLYDRTEINFVDTVLEDIEVEFIDQKTFDWFNKHYDKVGDKNKRWIFISDKIDKEKATDKIKEKLKIK